MASIAPATVAAAAARAGRQMEDGGRPMSSAELRRLAQDLQQPARRAALRVDLAPCAGPAEAAAALRRHGYAIGTEELAAASAALPDEALDPVSAGVFGAQLSPQGWSGELVSSLIGDHPRPRPGPGPGPG
jgi:hypothetical protein